MGFITGFNFAHATSMVSGGTNAYGGTGSVVTQATQDADIAANKLVMIDAGNASAIMVKPLMNAGSTDSGTGTDSAFIEIYGVIGFGEQSQTSYNTAPKFFYQLGTITASTVTNGEANAASTTGVFTTPGGTVMSSHTGCGTGADVKNSVFAMLPAMNTTPPDLVNIDIPDTNIGLAIAPGIDVFQQIALSFDRGDTQTETTGNALYALFY